MKNTFMKPVALLLALLMLISAAACTGSGDPADTTGAGITGSDTKAPDAGTADAECISEKPGASCDIL